jgi:hypothetical protein
MGAKPLTQPSAKLYDEDFVLWTAETARLLREGRFAEIDIDHVAEEIEDMGKRDHREMVSRLRLILQHLLKWQHQPDRRSDSWESTMVTQRRDLEGLFEQSPSLRAAATRSLPRAYRQAVEDAASETGIPESDFPRECPYTIEQILNRRFLPGS